MSYLQRAPEPQPSDMIQLLDFEGEVSDTWSRVRVILSHDRHEEVWEVLDSLGQVRLITAGAQPGAWLEVEPW